MINNIEAKFKETDIGPIPEEWKLASLSEVAEIQTGPFGSQLHESDYVETGTPIITVEHLINDRIEHSQNLPKVSREDLIRLSKYTLRSGDIVFSRVGSVDRVGYVSDAENGWLFSGRLLRVRPTENIDSKFLYYAISQPSIKEHVRSIAVGATMPSLNTKLLSGIPVGVPSMVEQKQIAEILSSLDDKIEVNRQINSNLEKIASSIFKHCFVDFEFPDKNGKSYKSSGGKMVYSELGTIPEEWFVSCIGDIAADDKNAIVDGPFGTQMKIAEYTDHGVPVVEMEYLEGYPFYKPFSNYISEEKYREVKRSTVRNGDIVISKTGTLGLLGIMTDLWEKAILVSRLAKITPDTNKVNRYYLFQVLKNLQKEKYWDMQSSGSTMPIINLTHIKSAKFILPLITLQNQYGQIAESFYKAIHNNLLEIQNLSALRDSLLPRIMRGKLRVL